MDKAMPLNGLKVLALGNLSEETGNLGTDLSTRGIRCHQVQELDAAARSLRGAASQGEPYRVLFLDVDMIGRGEHNLADVIGSLSQSSGTKTVLVYPENHRNGSGHFLPGVSAHLTKPVNNASLQACLASLLLDESRQPEAVLDQTALDNLRMLEQMGAVNLLQQMISTFIEQSNKTVEKLQNAASHKDFQALEANAHSLKSSSATMGATKLAELCKLLECSARAADHFDSDSLVATIAQEYEKARCALEKEYAGR